MKNDTTDGTADEGAVTPSKKPERTEEEEESAGRRNTILLFLLLICVLLINAAIALAIKLTDDDDDDDESTERSYDPNDLLNLTEAGQLMIKQAISARDDLLNETGCQYEALNWITMEDAANLTVPEDSASDEEKHRYIARYIMAIDYCAMGGESWTRDLKFLSADDICTWNSFPFTQEGVYCEAQGSLPKFFHFGTSSFSVFWQHTLTHFSSHVFEPQDDIGVVGTFPVENAKLKYMERLTVAEGDLDDAVIYEEFCKLSGLKYLKLTNSGFVGEIPSCLGDLSELIELDLSGNSLVGAIPESLCGLGNLKTFSADGNMLSEIPDCLCGIDTLSVSNNNFTVPDCS